MKQILFFMCCIAISFSVFGSEQTLNDKQMFQEIFSEWTKNFNQKNIAATCHLFSKEIIANYRGVPPKNYETICNGFKKIFSEKNHQYQYHFKLHQIYHSGNFAAVRITWYLAEYKNDKLTRVTQDEGLDVFIKNKRGEWQIINYLGYAI